MLKELPLSLGASLNSRPFNGLWLLCFTSCLQCCDLGYHASLARTLRTYLSAEYSLETSRHEGLDLLEGAVDAMDIRGDKLKFMDTHSQIFCPPACFDYQPHMGDEVSHHRIGFQGCLVVLGTKCISPCSLFSWWSSLCFLIPGVSGECTAACPDRALDAPPPAAVSPGHAEDWKWRGESAHKSQHFISKWSKLTASVLYTATFFSA